MGREPSGLRSMGLQRVRHDWSDWARMHTIYHLLWGEVCQELCQGSCSQTRNMKRKRDTEERGPLKVTESKERCQSTQTRGKGVPGMCQPSWLSQPSCAVYLVTQSCPALCDPMDCSLPAFSSVLSPFKATSFCGWDKKNAFWDLGKKNLKLK